MKKKTAALMLAAAMAVSLTACGGSGGTSETKAESSAAADTSAKKEEAETEAAGEKKDGSEYKIGLVTDVGGVNDGSFNQSSWEGEPKNLEEQAISLVGREIYEKLVKGYTEKQWGRDCKELPSFIIRRLPVRYTYDNNYFNDLYQGIPIGGYNVMIHKLFEGCEIETGVDYLENREYYNSLGGTVVYTGTIDGFYDYCFGRLEYRSLRFETEVLEEENHQGVAVVNYTDRETPYTRIIEHKHFEFGTQPKTVITREYPVSWQEGMEPYYPVNDEKNQALYQKYAKLAEKEENVIFGGRLGEYKYYDMDKVIESAMKKAEEIF